MNRIYRLVYFKVRVQAVYDFNPCYVRAHIVTPISFPQLAFKRDIIELNPVSMFAEKKEGSEFLDLLLNPPVPIRLHLPVFDRLFAGFDFLVPFFLSGKTSIFIPPLYPVSAAVAAALAKLVLAVARRPVDFDGKVVQYALPDKALETVETLERREALACQGQSSLIFHL